MKSGICLVLSALLVSAFIAYAVPPIIDPPVRINDPLGPDQTPGTPDDDDGTPPIEDKAMRDPAIAAPIVNNCPVLVTGFSDWSLRPTNLFTVGFARSVNLGASWVVNGLHTHNIVRQNLDPPPGTPWGGWLPEQKHPSVAADGNGNLYMVGYDFREVQHPTVSSRTSLWLARSTDQGASWTMKTIDHAEDPDPQKRIAFVFPSVAAHPRGGTVYVTWTRQDVEAGGSSVWFSVSTDAGQNFSPARQISPTYPPTIGNNVLSASAVAMDGTF